MFDSGSLALLVLFAILLTGCPPNEAPKFTDPDGSYMVSSARLLGIDSTFSLRDELTYPEHSTEGISDTSLSISDKELAIVRCEWCHECGFLKAWDWDNYGSSNWSPQYTGEEWGPIVARMMRKEMSFLQEEIIAKRIYEYLRDDSLGVYDEDADDEGAVIIEVDELPTPTSQSQVVTPAEQDGGSSGG